MSLCQALGVASKDIVCFVGAGGKTSASMLVAQQLAQSGQRVLVTTTTKIIEPAPTDRLRLVLAAELGDATAAVRQELHQVPIVVLARGYVDADRLSLEWTGPDYPVALRPHKLEGLPPQWMEPLLAEGGVDVMLIEADGANHRFLKAPAGHEPVIPSSATMVVPMADVEALGRPIADDVVHRPGLLADLLGVPIGSSISPEMLALALAHPKGGLKGVPPAARSVPLLTTHGAPSERSDIQEVVRRLLLSPIIDRVVVAHLRAIPPAVQVFFGGRE